MKMLAIECCETPTTAWWKVTPSAVMSRAPKAELFNGTLTVKSVIPFKNSVASVPVTAKFELNDKSQVHDANGLRTAKSCCPVGIRKASTGDTSRSGLRLTKPAFPTSRFAP